MKKLKAEEIQMNWEALMDIIEEYISGDRKEKLLKTNNEYLIDLSKIFQDSKKIVNNIFDNI